MWLRLPQTIRVLQLRWRARPTIFRRSGRPLDGESLSHGGSGICGKQPHDDAPGKP